MAAALHGCPVSCTPPRPRLTTNRPTDRLAATVSHHKSPQIAAPAAPPRSYFRHLPRATQQLPQRPTFKLRHSNSRATKYQLRRKLPATALATCSPTNNVGKQLAHLLTSSVRNLLKLALFRTQLLLTKTQLPQNTLLVARYPMYTLCIPYHVRSCLQQPKKQPEKQQQEQQLQQLLGAAAVTTKTAPAQQRDPTSSNPQKGPPHAGPKPPQK